jgi:hypothetical protein
MVVYHLHFIMSDFLRIVYLFLLIITLLKLTIAPSDRWSLTIFVLLLVMLILDLFSGAGRK